MSVKILSAAALMSIVATGAFADIQFGDNASDWAFDGECDDPRFQGPGMADTLLWEDAYHDQNDCEHLLMNGLIWPA